MNNYTSPATSHSAHRLYDTNTKPLIILSNSNKKISDRVDRMLSNSPGRPFENDAQNHEMKSKLISLLTTKPKKSLSSHTKPDLSPRSPTLRGPTTIPSTNTHTTHPQKQRVFSSPNPKQPLQSKTQTFTPYPDPNPDPDPNPPTSNWYPTLSSKNTRSNPQNPNQKSPKPQPNSLSNYPKNAHRKNQNFTAKLNDGKKSASNGGKLIPSWILNGPRSNREGGNSPKRLDNYSPEIFVGENLRSERGFGVGTYDSIGTEGWMGQGTTERDEQSGSNKGSSSSLKGFYANSGNMNSKCMIQHVLENSKNLGGGSGERNRFFGKSEFTDYLEQKKVGNMTAISGLLGKGGDSGTRKKTFESSSADHYSRGLKGRFSGIGGSTYKGGKRKRVMEYNFQKRVNNLAKIGMEKEQSSELNGYIKH
jgi:hypothetical protein